MEVKYEPLASGENRCESCILFVLKDPATGNGTCTGYEVNAKGVCNMFKPK